MVSVGEIPFCDARRIPLRKKWSAHIMNLLIPLIGCAGIATAIFAGTVMIKKFWLHWLGFVVAGAILGLAIGALAKIMY